MTLRIEDLVDRGLVPPERLDELRQVAAQFTVALTEDVAGLIFESLLLGARLAISAAVVALVVFLGARVTRQSDLTLDQCFNAVAFATSPLLVMPLAALNVDGSARVHPVANRLGHFEQREGLVRADVIGLAGLAA